jgi:hypothetical protein
MRRRIAAKCFANFDDRHIDQHPGRNRAQYLDPTGEPSRHAWSNGHVFGNGVRDHAIELSVAAKRNGYRGRHHCKLHDRGDYLCR